MIDAVQNLTERECAVNKKSKSLTNEVLAEKLTVEKLRIEGWIEECYTYIFLSLVMLHFTNIACIIAFIADAEEVQALRKLESARLIVNKEYEFTEQRDTMAKYELSEMKKTHEELVQSILEMRRENGNAVCPVLEKLKQDVRIVLQQIAILHCTTYRLLIFQEPFFFGRLQT